MTRAMDSVKGWSGRKIACRGCVAALGHRRVKQPESGFPKGCLGNLYAGYLSQRRGAVADMSLDNFEGESSVGYGSSCWSGSECGSFWGDLRMGRGRSGRMYAGVACMRAVVSMLAGRILQRAVTNGAGSGMRTPRRTRQNVVTRKGTKRVCNGASGCTMLRPGSQAAPQQGWW